MELKINGDIKIPKLCGQQYAAFSRKSIKAIGESSGHCVTDEVATLIIKDVNYKITELMHSSSQFMKHAGREKLTAADVNWALHYSDVPPIYGSGNPKPIEFIKNKDLGNFSVKEEMVDLVDLATAVDEQETVVFPFLTMESTTIVSPNNLLVTSSADEVCPSVSEICPIVSKEQSKYCELVGKAVLGDSNKMLKIALQDLRVSRVINPLLPYFVSFLCWGVKNSNHDINQLRNLLVMMDSLVRNQSLHISQKQYLCIFIELLLDCIKKPFPEYTCLDCHYLEFQEYAAHMLAKVLSMCKKSADDLYQFALSELNVIISAMMNYPLLSHLGAITAVMSCGPSVICRILYPYLNSYVAYLNKTLSDVSPATAQKRDTAQRIFYLLITAAGVILRFYSTPKGNSDPADSSNQSIVMENVSLMESNMGYGDNFDASDSSLLSELYKEFYSYFGDCLIVNLPPVHIQNVHLDDYIMSLFFNTERPPNMCASLSDVYTKEPEASPLASENSVQKSSQSSIKLKLRKLTSQSKTELQEKEKSSEWRVAGIIEIIERDSSSNSEDISLMRSTNSVNRRKTAKRTTNVKHSLLRKLTTGNIDGLL